MQTPPPDILFFHKNVKNLEELYQHPFVILQIMRFKIMFSLFICQIHRIELTNRSSKSVHLHPLSSSMPFIDKLVGSFPLFHICHMCLLNKLFLPCFIEIWLIKLLQNTYISIAFIVARKKDTEYTSMSFTSYIILLHALLKQTIRHLTIGPSHCIIYYFTHLSNSVHGITKYCDLVPIIFYTPLKLKRNRVWFFAI